MAGASVAKQKNKDIEVSWSVAEEGSTKKYEIERSANGTTFTKAGEVTAKGISGAVSYQWLDKSPLLGNNFYRIKGVDADASYKMSKIVIVKIDGTATAAAAMNVFPNPVINKLLKIQLNNLDKGEYTVQLINTQGQQIAQIPFKFAGGTGLQIFSLGKNISRGIYYVKIINNSISLSQAIFIE